MVRLPFIARISHPSGVGLKGEKIAVRFLRKKGLRILARNYRFKRKEIDIIAQDKETICFIEVKTRTTKDFGFPEEAVNGKKRRDILQIAVSYLKRFNMLGCPIRFDVISISWDKKKPEISYIKNAFISENFWTI